jgi:hypothetical protein
VRNAVVIEKKSHSNVELTVYWRTLFGAVVLFVSHVLFAGGRIAMDIMQIIPSRWMFCGCVQSIIGKHMPKVKTILTKKPSDFRVDQVRIAWNQRGDCSWIASVSIAGGLRDFLRARGTDPGAVSRALYKRAKKEGLTAICDYMDPESMKRVIRFLEGVDVRERKRSAEMDNSKPNNN